MVRQPSDRRPDSINSGTNNSISSGGGSAPSDSAMWGHNAVDGESAMDNEHDDRYNRYDFKI